MRIYTIISLGLFLPIAGCQQTSTSTAIPEKKPEDIRTDLFSSNITEPVLSKKIDPSGERLQQNIEAVIKKLSPIERQSLKNEIEVIINQNLPLSKSLEAITGLLQQKTLLYQDLEKAEKEKTFPPLLTETTPPALPEDKILYWEQANEAANIGDFKNEALYVSMTADALLEDPSSLVAISKLQELWQHSAHLYTILGENALTTSDKVKYYTLASENYLKAGNNSEAQRNSELATALTFTEFPFPDTEFPFSDEEFIPPVNDLSLGSEFFLTRQTRIDPAGTIDTRYFSSPNSIAHRIQTQLPVSLSLQHDQNKTNGTVSIRHKNTVIGAMFEKTCFTAQKNTTYLLCSQSYRNLFLEVQAELPTPFWQKNARAKVGFDTPYLSPFIQISNSHNLMGTELGQLKIMSESCSADLQGIAGITDKGKWMIQTLINLKVYSGIDIKNTISLSAYDSSFNLSVNIEK
jgi:hypothetical protein